jgi:hypothetical protein
MPYPARPGPMGTRSVRAIPRISHDQRQAAASGGVQLHRLQTTQGRQGVPELYFPVVAEANSLLALALLPNR